MDFKKLIDTVESFETAAHSILGDHESAHQSRVVHLDQAYGRLAKLSVQQDDLLRQALRCIEAELFRAAHVMTWAAFMDYYEELLDKQGLGSVAAIRPKWKTASLEDLRESVSEHQLVEVGRDLGMLTKNQTKSLLGLLHRRNECAHPSSYFPDMNQALGYFSEVIDKIALLQRKFP